MKMSAKDLKALEWYIKDRKLKPQLSSPPKMYFKDENGKSVEADLTGIVLEYNAWNEEDQKRRAREKRIKDTGKLIRKAW